MPKVNTEYWENKFIRNQERDIRKRDQLVSLGWEVIIFWECEIKKNIEKCVQTMRDLLMRN